MTAPYLLGIDLGKQTDHTALVLVDPTGDEMRPTYPVRHIERVPLRTRYTEIVSHTAALVNVLREPIEIRYHDRWDDPETIPTRDVTIILDYTGVGLAVAEMFLDAHLDCSIILVTITGGMKVTVDETGYHVPKGDLVSAVQRTLQEERLRLPADDPATPLLTKELADFQAKISPSGHISFGTVADWRSGQHDDLVLAAALALWWGESRRPVEVY